MKIISSTSKTRWNTTHENMMRAVVSFALAPANIAVTQSIVAFETLINNISNKMVSVNALRATISTPSTGYAAQKQQLKMQLSDTSAAIMKAVYTWAVTNNNMVLAHAMHISDSDLMKMKDVDLYNYITNAIALVTPITSALQDYGVTAQTITDWSTLNDNFNDVISNPKNTIASRKAVNANIQQMLLDCMVMLTAQCDQLVCQFETLNTKYFDTYFANRKLNPTHVSTQLRAHVQNELNQPIANAVVSIVGTELSATTDSQGYCHIPGVPFGMQSVMVTTGNNTKTFGPIEFKKGQSHTEHFTTIPAFATPAVMTTAPVTVSSH